MWRCQESVTSQAHYGRIFGWGGGVWGEGSENQHAAVSCGALHFQHGKSSGGCRGNKSQISTERTPLCSTPPYHPCSRLPPRPPPPSPSSSLLLPGHLSADRELRPQTGLLRGAGSRDQAQTRDHVQSSTLDPRAGACASGYWCAADSLPSSPPSSSLFYCCHLLCTQTPQKVICIHSLLSSRFCRLRDVLLPIPLIFSTFIN